MPPPPPTAPPKSLYMYVRHTPFANTAVRCTRRDRMVIDGATVLRPNLLVLCRIDTTRKLALNALGTTCRCVTQQPQQRTTRLLLWYRTHMPLISRLQH